ncbi:hypothetical protein JCGZ_26791 [Jatropha curcas]|uniref:F-box protein n=1 Tax=Jatropha curcas TaxID=180498 RepID=A0A067L3J8_JATCU|nr:uncharacterized protein LOC105630143 [Jatropha curcas]XP_037497454.1 uncharacterized protein LOC105630143 [Jatropha curcas]KDP41773.1 hypothetical protein JCGZ_26791 [Jatropha curcas]
MSDQAAQSDNGKDEIPEKYLQSQQSVWMSHWTHTSYRSANVTHNKLLLNCESGHNSQRIKHHPLLGRPETEPDSSKFVKKFRDMHKTFLNESSRKLTHETFKGQHFPMFKSSLNKDGMLSPKNEESSRHLESQIGLTAVDVSLGRTDNHLPSMLKWVPSKAETQSTESQFRYEGITSNPEQHVKINELLENNIVVSSPPENGFLGSTSRTMPSDFNGRNIPTESFIHGQEYTNQPSSSFLVDEKKMNNHAPLFIHDPSTSNNQLGNFVGGQLQTMPKHSSVKLLTNQMRLPEGRLHPGSLEVPRISSYFNDVETMRICTATDSPKFSQTTHHFLITEKTDVNLSDGGELFRESTISTKFKRKPVGEGKEKTENVHTEAIDLKNESSAETDTMDMDTLQENRLSGKASSISNKDVKGTQKSSSSQVAVAPVKEETRDGLSHIEIPDINQELPIMPGGASSADDEEMSTSRTQSLDVEHFLSNTEHPTDSKSSACADSPPGSDPSSRWVKRLKPSTSHSFPNGTKSTKMGEASSHEKVNKLFSKILNGSKTNSEPKKNKSYGKQKMFLDETTELLRNAESASTDSEMKCQDITLSHPWIQRWCHKPAVSSKKKPEAMVVVFEPQNSKGALDELQEKQFPSIAAMALMGKAMTGFGPCELKKLGASVVWNTKRSS